MDRKNIKGISMIESLVCIVVIGIGFIAMLQLSSFSINAMDRSIEKNKLNFLSEMILEDLIGDPDNTSSYIFDQTGCNYNSKGGNKLSDKKKDKWREKLEEKNFLKFEKQSRFIDKKPYCESGDFKKTFINNEIGKVNFSNGKGKRKKYLGVVVK